eukprot:1177368-Prorocentrum_minimum.AAC.2
MSQVTLDRARTDRLCIVAGVGLLSSQGKRVGVALVSRGVAAMMRAEPSLIKSGVFAHAVGMRLFDPIDDNFLQCCSCRWRPCQVPK